MEAFASVHNKHSPFIPSEGVSRFWGSPEAERGLPRDVLLAPGANPESLWFSAGVLQLTSVE